MIPKYFLCVPFCLAVWVCLKLGSENMVLVVLLHIGAKELTVSNLCIHKLKLFVRGYLGRERLSDNLDSADNAYLDVFTLTNLTNRS